MEYTLYIILYKLKYVLAILIVVNLKLLALEIFSVVI